MVSDFFMSFALIGSEWVLYFLVLLSIYSVAIIYERIQFYRNSTQSMDTFREQIRALIQSQDYSKALKLSQSRRDDTKTGEGSFDAHVISVLIEKYETSKSSLNTEEYSMVARDVLLRIKLKWEKNLSILATIGSNAPFVGLFGTVLGIVQAFRSLSQQTETGVQLITAGLSEALIATAIGILVAIPAVVAYNLFQGKVKSALTQAEALQNFMISQLTTRK